MQGAGNDFVIINNIKERVPFEKLPLLAARVCSRRLSVGADGLMVIEKAENGGDFKMLFYNSDGSVGEMCGNGARCIARYGCEHGLASGEEQRIETVSGTVIGRKVSRRQYTVRLNFPTVIDLERRVAADGEEYVCSYIELGTPGLPHCVVLMDGWEKLPREKLRRLGAALRSHPSFPKGANVTFCEITAPNEVRAVTFERGVEDFTLACGTGCGSTALALSLRGLADKENVKITMPGGVLSVAVTDENGAYGLYLTGPTNTVAEGELLDEDLAL